MGKFARSDTAFSLCGLNCALCPMQLDGYCPGCGGGPGNQPCAIARCSVEQGGMEYCHQCGAYPCERYQGIDAYDSFITHRHQLRDMQRAKAMGAEAYQAELREKLQILRALLAGYNDGRRKSFYCVAANLLSLQDLREGMAELSARIKEDQNIKEKAALAVKVFQAKAAQCGVVLKLNKKPENK